MTSENNGGEAKILTLSQMIQRLQIAEGKAGNRKKQEIHQQSYLMKFDLLFFQEIHCIKQNKSIKKYTEIK